MKRSPRRSASAYTRTIAGKLGLTTTRGRLIALFVSVAAVAAITVTVASSAKSVRNLLPGRTFNTNLSNRASEQNKLPSMPQNNAARSGFLSSAVSANEGTPTITTDREAYEPGETITFTGANWTPGESVTITLNDETGGVAAAIQTTADESGAFTATGIMPGANVASAPASGAPRPATLAADSSAVYTATATGAASGATAQVQIREGAAAQADGDADDPDLPAFMAGMINKEDYLRRREEHVNKLRGIRAGQTFDPRARGRAIQEMNRQEGRAGNTANTNDAGGPLSAPIGQINPNTPSSSSTWSSIGPSPLPNGQTFNTNNVPVSGRISAIAIHPTNSNIAYVGAAQGGVYRTLDGGATWTPIFDNAQTMAIGSIAIAPSQPSTIYVGTGEGNLSCDSYFGVGVYRIDNADGSTPTLSGPFNQDTGGTDQFSGRSIAKVLVHPTNPDIIFVGTGAGIGGIGCNTIPGVDSTATSLRPRGLYRSTNATSASPTFTKLTVATENSGNRLVSDMEFEPGNPNTMLATVFGFSTAGSGGVYRSTNALAATPTFTRTLSASSTTTSERFEIAINKVGAQVNVFAVSSQSSGILKRSIDGGQTWSAAIGTSGFCGGQCTYDMPVAVDPTDGNLVYLGGPGDSSPAHILTKVTNALGTPTFTASQTGLHADEHAIEIDPSNHTTIWTGNDGGIFKSTDAASGWTSLNNAGFVATQFQSIAVHPTDGNFTIGGTQDNGTECQGPCGTFTGNTWNQADYGDGGFALIDQTATNLINVNMYHTYFNQTSNLIGYAYVTNTANAKFISNPTSDSWSFNGTGGSVSCTNGGGYLCSEAVEFYMPMALGPGSPNPIYSGTDQLHRATSPGATNTSVSQVFASGVPISAVGISPQNDQVRIVGLDNGKVFRTMTGQTSGWPDVTGTIPAAYVSRAVIDPTNQNTAYVTLSIYFGAATPHIYKTTNLNAATPTWTGIGTTIPDVPVNAFVVDPSNSSFLYAGTDIGVYRSTDGGATWAPFSNGLPRVAVFDMAIQNSSRTLRIATHGRGMWEIFIGATGTLQGTVTDASTSSPINGATVTAGSNTTTTNASGFYQFTNVPVGTYSVSASAPGYNNNTVSGVNVTNGGTTTQNIALSLAPTSGCLIDTSQADFQAGTATNLNLTTSPGDVKLASSAGALDQQNTNVGSTGQAITTTTWQAQTFIPGVSGQITQVDADLFCSGCSGTNPAITIEIRPTSGGTPTSTVLASTTLTGFSSGAGQFYSATFSSPANLTTGTTYAVVARLLTNRTTGTYAWLRSANNQYANGAWIQGTSCNSGTLVCTWASNSQDLGFKTYISTGFNTSGDLISSVKDSNPAVSSTPNWTTLSWTASTPANTTVKFQAAGSSSASGPFNFVGPDGTASTFFTTNGASLSQFNGNRYLKYRAYLSTTNSSATPTLNDVTACFSNVMQQAATSLAVSAASGAYGGTTSLSATLTASGSPVSGKTISFTLNGNSAGSAVTNASGVASLASVSLAGINVGSYPTGVGASFAGDSSYQASAGSNSLTVSKATPTITWSNPANIVYGTALSATQLNATASVPGNFVYTPAAGTVLHVGNGQNLHAAFTPTDTTNYNTATKDVSINVTKATLTVTANNQARAYGDANPPLTYMMTGFVNGDTQASATTGQPAIITTANNTSAPGAYTITAAAGTLNSSNYSFSFVNGTLTVTKADQTINFGALATKTYGDADFALSATASSGLAVSFAASGNCTVSGSTVHITGAGSCTITASQGGDTNYNAAPSVPQSFTINKADSTTNVSISNATYNGQPHGATASVTGFGGLSQSLSVTYVGRNATVYGPSTTAPTSAGDYTASASFSGDNDHNSSSDSKDYTIAKANADIHITPYSVTYDGNPHTATGTATGVESPSPADLSSLLDLSGTTHTNASSYPNDAWSFAGNNNYNPASGTTSDQIDKASSTVTVNCPASETYTGAALEPCAASYTGAGGLSGTLTPTYMDNVNVGTAHASATYGGDANHDGSSNSATFEITKASSTVTVTCPPSATYTGAALTPCSAVVTGAGSLNESLSVTYTNNTNAGTATASASYGGDANHTGSNDSKHFDITPAATTTTVNCPASETYTGAAMTPCTATVTGANLSLTPTPNYANNVNVGTAIASYTYAGDANHTGSSDSKNFQITSASSTTVVTFEAGPYVYRGSAFTATAMVTGAGGLNAPVTVVYTGDCTNVTTTNGCTATATYAGDANHDGSSDSQSITITKATASIALSDLTQTYSGTPRAATATTTPSGLSGVSVTYNGSPTAPTGAGSYAVVASLNNQNYQADDATGTLTIEKAAPIISVTGNTCTYNGSPCAGSGSATGVDSADLGAVTLTYTLGGTAPVNAGSYTVVASIGETANHTAGNSAPATITINKAAPTVSVTVPSGPVTYDGNAHPATGFAYGVGGVGDVLSPAVTFTYNGDGAAPINADTYTVVASFGGNDNYLPAVNNSTSIIIVRAAAHVSITGGTFTYDGAAHPATGFTYGIGGVSDVLAPTVTFTYNGNAAAPVNAATYNVVASFAGNTNYEPASDTATILINKATPTITWSNPADIIYGTALSGTQLNAAASVPGSFAYTPAAGTVLNAGNGQNLHIEFTPADTTDYNGASKDVAINVLKASQTITFGALANKTYGDAPFTVSSTGGASGNPVTFSASGNCTASGTNGSTITITGAGGCTVTASQAGNGNYNAAPDVVRSFSIAKATATISLSNLYYLYDGLPHGATATTNPAGLSGVSFNYVGQTLSYNSSTPPAAAGTYAVTASLANNNYAATPVSAAFVINAAPAVTITGPASGAIYTKGSTVSFTGMFVDNPGTHTAVWTFTSSTQTITQAGTVNETTGTVSASYTFANTGVYTVKLTVTDNFNVIGEATTVNNVAGAVALIAVYDPSSTGGSVSTTTKSPLYSSLAGWYPANPTLTGTATIGFNASYPSATATVPTGQAVFNFTAANLSFASLSYKWMVVSKPYVWLRGTGTVNNVSGYEFLIAAVDGQLTGGGGTDKFRIRIWKSADGTIIYDNMPNTALNAVAVTTTSNGDIAIK